MFQITADELPRFMQCNGSRLMKPSHPPLNELEDFTARDEGIAAHWLAKEVFAGNTTIEEMIDRKAVNGVYITPEMAEHVADYLELIYGEVEVDTSFGDETWRVAARADNIWYNTTDLIYNSETGLVISEPETLHIRDFKYGWRIVEPENNWTLMAHAIGFCLSRQIKPKEIHLSIYQPRPHHFDGSMRTWKLSYVELLAKYTVLVTAVTNPTNELRTGPACNKCHALATCPAAQAAQWNAIDASELAHNDQVNDETLAFELDTLRIASERMKSRLAALEELAAFRIKQGKVIKNYSLEMGYGNRVWNEGLDAVMLQMLTGKDLRKPSVVTPKQAEKLGVSETVVKSLVHRPMTGLKLVRMDASKKAKRLLGK